MARPVLVTGATGTLGRAVVAELVAAGQPVRALSRRARSGERRPAVSWVTGDLRTGEGFRDAVAGTGAVIHCATDPRRPWGDLHMTGVLVAAAAAAGRPHLVHISIVGVDRIPFGYYRAKLAAEQLVESSGLPWTILRATQFHDLLLAGSRLLARLPVVPVPAGFRFQPVDTGEVAALLVALALHAPAGRVSDLGGPRVLSAAEVAAVYLRTAGLRRAVVGVRLPGAAARAVRAGHNLTPDHADGHRSYEGFVGARLAVGTPARRGAASRGR